MKKIIIICLILAAKTFCFAQKDYTDYYNIIFNYQLNSPDPEKKVDLNSLEPLYLKAFSVNKPLAYDLIELANHFYISGNLKKGEKYLLQAANAGYEIDEMENFPAMDSVLKADKNLKEKFNKNYSKFLKEKCDVPNSIKITKLFDSDQHIREYLREYIENDTVFKKFRGEEMTKCDSINYFSLLEILKSPNFNSSNLTYWAQLGIGIILTHSATNRYANPDTVFAILKNEMLKGVVSPRFYANSVDRYYMYIKGLNYYCNFYDDTLPIYDIENVDKRRSEVWLYSLYFKFKWNKRSDELPKDYKYDLNTIGK